MISALPTFRFAERCPVTLVAGLAGSSIDKYVVTTDLHGNCIDGYQGTTSSSAMVSGIIALTLQVGALILYARPLIRDSRKI